MSAIILCVAMPLSASAKPGAQDGVGEIVQPATGTDRAVYAPIAPSAILPHFLGDWATRSGNCVGQSYKNRMGLKPDLAIIAGEALTVRTVYVDTGTSHDRDDDAPPRAADYADARDMLASLVRPGSEAVHFVHFRFSEASGRLIVEEVGKPRRAYVRCSM
ncbi:hypothetical protein [Sphingopyxis terrae]|nr:hypothetical protein [Sphingopyxis terrae]MDX8356865.1 hypothetical protein [Sphingopyxis terrae]